jgi:hypothetical protein
MLPARNGHKPVLLRPRPGGRTATDTVTCMTNANAAYIRER